MKRPEPMTLSKDVIMENAVQYLISGYNCAQTTLLCCQELLEIRNDDVLKSATGFGGGMGNRGEICGAVSGGVMALSQKFGRVELSEEEARRKEYTYELVSAYLNKFKEFEGSLYCRDILGVDISDQAKRKAYWTVENRRKCGEGQVAKALEMLYFIFEQDKISKTK
ncbi:MAG: C_GCAxxG_C_C family protein [Desulfobacteraceae bacterium]|nr:C_GCAxxG_C_C family protein [Desulfobacteraceae bacterium]